MRAVNVLSLQFRFAKFLYVVLLALNFVKYHSFLTVIIFLLCRAFIITIIFICWVGIGDLSFFLWVVEVVTWFMF